jgi:hypothetical protein
VGVVVLVAFSFAGFSGLEEFSVDSVVFDIMSDGCTFV